MATRNRMACDSTFMPRSFYVVVHARTRGLGEMGVVDDLFASEVGDGARTRNSDHSSARKRQPLDRFAQGFARGPIEVKALSSGARATLASSPPGP